MLVTGGLVDAKLSLPSASSTWWNVKSGLYLNWAFSFSYKCLILYKLKSKYLSKERPPGVSVWWAKGVLAWIRVLFLALLFLLAEWQVVFAGLVPFGLLLAWRSLFDMLTSSWSFSRYFILAEMWRDLGKALPPFRGSMVLIWGFGGITVSNLQLI